MSGEEDALLQRRASFPGGLAKLQGPLPASGLSRAANEKGPAIGGAFSFRSAAAERYQRSETTLSETRGSRRSPRYWLAIGSSDTSNTSVAPKPLNAVFIAAP